MPRTRHLLDALRLAALWLLVASVFFGPAGLAGSAALASSAKTCGASCPCEEAAHDTDADERDEHAAVDSHHDHAVADSEHDDGEPCKSQCPDGCPNCGCCLGVAMAVLPPTEASGAISGASARIVAPVPARASGTCSGVFRPPRSLT